MQRFWLGIAAIAVLSACGSGSGGNPFATDTETDAPEVGIPEELIGDLEGITYNPSTQTLTVRGVALDDTPFEAVYTRKAALDRAGYEAYTAQDGSLDRHFTAYVKEVDGARGAIIVSGGQFGHYFRGSVYGRTGAYTPPSAAVNGTGLVTYVGNYVGMVNGPGDGGDLLPVQPGTPSEVLSVQAAEITGKVILNADFADNVTNGLVYDREFQDLNVVLPDLELAPAAIDPVHGTFTSDVTIATESRGTYGGIFSGTDASAVAGTLYVEDHIDDIQNEEETGLFVLSQCGTPAQDALCNQPTQ